MTYTIKMHVSNPGTQPLKTVVYGGTIFEVLDPYSGVQNLSVAGDTTIVVPPGETQLIEVDAFCLNQSFRPPHGNAMRPTSLTLSNRLDRQDRVWDDLRRRR
jgi:hypothetical protein